MLVKITIIYCCTVDSLISFEHLSTIKLLGALSNATEKLHEL